MKSLKYIRPIKILSYLCLGFTSISFSTVLSNTVDIQFEGNTYTIKSQQTSDDLEFNPTTIKSEPWYGSASAAEFFINEVNIQLGDYRGRSSVSIPPFVLYQLPSDESSYSSWSTYGDISGFWDNNDGSKVAVGFGTTSVGSSSFFDYPIGLLANNNFYFLTSSPTSTPLHTEWVQPYAAMQSVGLRSIKNNRDLVLTKAGECNNNGWVIGDTDYCVYTNAKNNISYVNGDSTKGSYDNAVFNGSINIEKTINEKWKAGIAYGQGTANLYNFNFSGTTANLNSSNNHYSVYGVKQVSDKFTLKAMVGGSVFDYKGSRNYTTTSAISNYETDGYTAEINGIWDIEKNIKNMKTPIRLRPTMGVAYAAHAQDGFDESGSGDLITVDPNQAEQLLFKSGISIDKQISMEGGKWLLVPSLALNYEMDNYAGDDHRSINGKVIGSSDASTKVSAKTFGQHNGSVKVGADFVCTEDFIFNLNAKYGLATDGDEYSYGGGFRWQF